MNKVCDMILNSAVLVKNKAFLFILIDSENCSKRVLKNISSGDSSTFWVSSEPHNSYIISAKNS